MQHLDEGTIHAWLDGALAPNEASAAEAHVAACEECARAVAEARGLIAASSRILGALDDVPAVQGSTGALSLPLIRTGRGSWLRRGGLGYAVAATALLAVGTTLVWSKLSPDAAMDSRVSAVDEAAPAPQAVTTQPLMDTSAAAGAERKAASAPPTARNLSRDAVADPKNVAPTATSAKLSAKESQPPKEELAIDRVVPLPGAMPRPAAPKSTPPIRQEADRKALADAAANAAQISRPAQVRGRVLDAATGAPVVGAHVSIDTPRVVTQTDGAGRFQLQSVPLGTQTVHVRAIGFQPAQHPVDVAASDSVQLAFALQKSVVALEQVVVTGTATGAQLRREAQVARRDAPQSSAVAGQEGARLSAARSATSVVAGCYTLRVVAQDKARDEDRAMFASLPTRVELESELVDRSRANEQSRNRARTLAGNTRAESWRMVGDSLEVALVEGDRRHTLRFARRDARWVSDVAVMERCATP